MNKTLEHVIAEMARLLDDEQETIAWLILEEMAAERDLEDRFAKSGTGLEDLARRARAQHANGETTALTFPPNE